MLTTAIALVLLVAIVPYCWWRAVRAETPQQFQKRLSKRLTLLELEAIRHRRESEDLLRDMRGD